jgi:hypothetical protein
MSSSIRCCLKRVLDEKVERLLSSPPSRLVRDLAELLA